MKILVDNHKNQYSTFQMNYLIKRSYDLYPTMYIMKNSEIDRIINNIK